MDTMYMNMSQRVLQNNAQHGLGAAKPLMNRNARG